MMQWDRQGEVVFLDRREAGRALAEHLAEYARRKDVLVLALPRGGVPVGYELARALGVELGIFVVRKIGMPGHPEFAVGAIASGGIEYFDEDVLRHTGVDPAALQAVISGERAELARRERIYRGDRPMPPLEGRTLIVVDDGLATGASMQAAVRALRAGRPHAIVVAVPVAPYDAQHRFEGISDGFACVRSPRDFRAVGQFYHDFKQVDDEEVRALLAQARGGNR